MPSSAAIRRIVTASMPSASAIRTATSAMAVRLCRGFGPRSPCSGSDQIGIRALWLPSGPALVPASCDHLLAHPVGPLLGRPLLGRPLLGRPRSRRPPLAQAPLYRGTAYVIMSKQKHRTLYLKI